MNFQLNKPVEVALFEQRCTVRQSTALARQDRQRYLTIQVGDDHPDNNEKGNF